MTHIVEVKREVKPEGINDGVWAECSCTWKSIRGFETYGDGSVVQAAVELGRLHLEVIRMQSQPLPPPPMVIADERGRLRG